MSLGVRIALLSGATDKDDLLVPGAHVRVFTSNFLDATQRALPEEGTLRAIDAAGAILATAETEGEYDRPRLQVIPRDRIIRTEVRVARSRGLGALIGIGTALAPSGALALACPCNDVDVTRGDVFIVLGYLSVPLGAGIGALVPLSERWQTVPPPSDSLRIGLTTGPNRRGIAVALTIPLGRPRRP